MNEVKEIESIIKGLLPRQNAFVVEPYPRYPQNRIGIDEGGNAVILVNTIISTKDFFTDAYTENLSVFYNKKCSIVIGEAQSNSFFSILLLKDNRLLYYFINLFELLIQKIGESPELIAFKEEVDNIRMLFNQVTIPGQKTLLGLWGELFLIECALDPSYLISSWHKFANDTADFNDGEQKIEVKTTTRAIRIHEFSQSQLKSIINPNTIVASIMTVEIDNGLSINDLLEKIKERIPHSYTSILISKVIDVMGNGLKYSSESKFDYTTALNTVRYFYSNDIPNIKEIHIPDKIRNIRFEVELEEWKSIKKKLNSKLYKFLFQRDV